MSETEQKSNLFDRTVWAVGLLGFASGLPLPRVFGTLSLWLKDAGLSNAAIGFFAAASAMRHLASPPSIAFAMPPCASTSSMSPILSQKSLARKRAPLTRRAS